MRWGDLHGVGEFDNSIKRTFDARTRLQILGQQRCNSNRKWAVGWLYAFGAFHGDGFSEDKQPQFRLSSMVWCQGGRCDSRRNWRGYWVYGKRRLRSRY